MSLIWNQSDVPRDAEVGDVWDDGDTHRVLAPAPDAWVVLDEVHPLTDTDSAREWVGKLSRQGRQAIATARPSVVLDTAHGPVRVHHIAHRPEDAAGRP